MIPLARGVAPFGHPWITACSRLPRAFRSVPRPSSPPGAKASTECPSRARPNPLATEPPRTAPKRAAQPAPSTSVEEATPGAQRAGRGQPRTHIHPHTHFSAPDAHRTAASAINPAWINPKKLVRHQPCRALHERPNPDSRRKDHTPPRRPQPPSSRSARPRRDPVNPRRNALAWRRPRLETPSPGDDRDRTGDPLLAKQVLSQLSYAPTLAWAREDLNLRPHAYQACALTN
jgi:hypothetical protein